jgi:hypothetical protein
MVNICYNSAVCLASFLIAVVLVRLLTTMNYEVIIISLDSSSQLLFSSLAHWQQNPKLRIIQSQRHYTTTPCTAIMTNWVVLQEHTPRMHMHVHR